MFKINSETKLVWWPTPQDYNEAIQTPQANLLDNELRSGLPYTNALELPRSITGSFASVYRMHCEKKDFALRLFLSNIRDQNERYALISDFVQRDALPYTVTFDFLREGIKVHGEWLPALKMDWLEGEQFDHYIGANLGNAEKLGALLDKFVRMMQDLRRAGIAHGDLQHGNILVCHDQLRLVDYDGMFVPKMKGLATNELGHRNYQHPERAAHHFGPYLDNFSAWVIYASVRALQIDARLMHQLGGGDDCLLFRQSDFADPLHSAAFAAMEKHSDPTIKNLAQFVRLQLKTDLEKIPYLELPIPQVQEQELQPVAESVPTIRSGARLVRGNLPDWLHEENGEVVAHSTTVHTKSPEQAVWFKPGEARLSGRLSAGQSNSSQSNPSQSKSSQANTIPPTAAKTQSNMQSAGTNLQKTGAPKSLLPLELQSKIPRRVKWNPRSEQTTLVAWFALLLLNPAIWLMFSFGFNAYGIDSELESTAQMASAQVTALQARPAKDGDSRIDYTYTFDHQLYKGSALRRVDARTIDELGSSYYVYVLPKNPTVHEGLNERRGSKRLGDQSMAFLCLLLNLVLIISILRAPLRDRKLAQMGAPLLARVDSIDLIKVPKTGVQLYKAALSFSWAGKQRHRTIYLTKVEYDSLQIGSNEVILYDEIRNQLRLYRFCRYNAISLPSKASKRASNLAKWLKP
ncbi:MAG: hypothetical protein JST89_09225 [Cyanobacteria bacterium SZAS-4]|nr:hypothetical protein [Cyanobacteria bacterium SZAS-4]